MISLIKYYSFSGKTTDQISDMLEKDRENLNKFLRAHSCKSYIFKLRTELKTYDCGKRNQITVNSVAPLNHKDYNDYLIKNIQRLIEKH